MGHERESLSIAKIASDETTGVHEPLAEPLKFGLGRTVWIWMNPPNLSFFLPSSPHIGFAGTGTIGPIFQNKVRAWSMDRDRERIQQKYNRSKQSLRFL